MAKPVFDTRDYEKNHLWGALAYIIFFLPLITCPSSRFGRFCANQGVLLWIMMAAVSLIFGILGLFLNWIPLIGWLVGLAGNLCKLAVFALMLYYGFKAYSGHAEPLPVIGGIELIR